ncbi:MAG TPA: NAD(P)-dependent oxidoreductase [Burkholderiaceae bacterium]|nr:NAD(P)-dependent oxidoreductase [Burkholderiaceae bacterium]
MSKQSVAFIGTGIMGAPMAGHLARAGYPVTLHDRDPAQMQAAIAAEPALKTAASPAAAADGADIVITMLPDGAVVQQVALGDQGLVHGLKAGALLLDTSSSQPWLTTQTAAALAARGIAMVDAPVSGAQWGAQAAELVFMIGGAPADVERVMPLLKVMGRQCFHLGPVGAGHVMKCLNNLITAMTFAATIEGMLVGRRFGLDSRTMVDVLNVSTGQSWLTQNHVGQRIVSGTFDDPFKMVLMNKDIAIAMELAQREGVPMPMSALGQQLWKAAGVPLPADASISEFARYLEKMAGTALADDGSPLAHRVISRPPAGPPP